MTVIFEDLAVGHVFPAQVKGPLTTSHIMRWSAAMENWHRIHYDWRFATQHDGLPDVLINGSWKQHSLAQLVKDSLGETGWMWRLKFRYRAMDVAGDTLTTTAEVTRLDRVDNLGFVGMRITMRNQRDVISTTGSAVGVLPLQGGPPVPYPFAPTPAQQDIQLPGDE